MSYCYEVSLVNELLFSVTPFGYLDLQRCTQILVEAKIYFGDFGQYYEEFLNDIGWDSNKQTPDICGIAYDYILQQARTEIQEKTNVDILNDLKSEIWVYGNYMCSSFDWSDNQETINIIERIPAEERSDILNWFYDQIS